MPRHGVIYSFFIFSNLLPNSLVCFSCVLPALPATFFFISIYQITYSTIGILGIYIIIYFNNCYTSVFSPVSISVFDIFLCRSARFLVCVLLFLVNRFFGFFCFSFPLSSTIIADKYLGHYHYLFHFLKYFFVGFPSSEKRFGR